MSKQKIEVASDVHFTGSTESQNPNYKYDMLLSHLYSLSSGTPMVSDGTNKHVFYVNNVEYTVPGVYVQPLDKIETQPATYTFSGSDYIDKQDDALGIGDVRLLISSDIVASFLKGNALKIITEQINGRSGNYTIDSENTSDYKVIQTFIPYGHNIIFKRLAFRAEDATTSGGKNRYSYSKFWIDWCASIGPTYDSGSKKFLFKTPILQANEISAFTLNGNISPADDAGLGTSDNPFENIYGKNGLFTEITATEITATDSGYRNKTNLFGINGILKDIDNRLTNMGFKEGPLNTSIPNAKISTIGTYTFVFFPAGTYIPYPETMYLYPEGFSGPSTTISIVPTSNSGSGWTISFGKDGWGINNTSGIVLRGDTFCVWKTEATYTYTYTYTTTAISFESTRVVAETKNISIDITDASPRISEIISVDKESNPLVINSYSWDKNNNRLTINYANLTGYTITTPLIISYYD